MLPSKIGSYEDTQGDYSQPDFGQFLRGRYEDSDFKLSELILLWGYNPPIQELLRMSVTGRTTKDLILFLETPTFLAIGAMNRRVIMPFLS